MTTFRGTDDTGRPVQPLDPENLRALLQTAPGSVTVADVETEGRTVRLSRDGERWLLDVHPGSDLAALRTSVPNTDAAFDLVRSWCADDGWWRTAFRWDPVPA